MRMIGVTKYLFRDMIKCVLFQVSHNFRIRARVTRAPRTRV